MQQALIVQSGTEAAQKSLQEALACLGKIVRLKRRNNTVYVAPFRDEAHSQALFDDAEIYGQLRMGVRIIGIEVFKYPLQDFSSSESEKCYVGLRFMTAPSVFWPFPAWQFDLTGK